MKTNYPNAIRELVNLTLDQEVFNAIKEKVLIGEERFAGLCLVTHQFNKAQKILKKYRIKI